jgi:hypothetical protein
MAKAEKSKAARNKHFKPELAIFQSRVKLFRGCVELFIVVAWIVELPGPT